MTVAAFTAAADLSRGLPIRGYCMKIAGLDIGTTGCKCTVFDEEGNYLGRAYHDYSPHGGRNDLTIDAADIVDGVFDVIRAMAAQYPDIGGIGVTSFGETFVAADDRGEPLYPSMLYTDPRGEQECAELTARIGEDSIAQITGLRPHQMYSISKVLWLKRNKPEIWKRVCHIFLIGDYIIFRLTGGRMIDYSLATRTMAFDIRRLQWSSTIFEAAGVDSSLFSKPVPTGSIAGVLTREAADRTGLSCDTKVIAVSHDQIAACVGAGTFQDTIAVDGAGTVECLTPIFHGMPDREVLSQGYFPLVPYVVPDTYAVYAFSYTGGALMQWCTDTLAGKERQEAAAQGISVNAYLEEQYRKEHAGKEDAPGSLLVLPHFAGAATPYMDTGSKGAILGLTLGSSVADIYRGCMEGIAYEMYLNYELLKKAGVRCRELRATGGGAHSAVWMQIKADMLNLPITALKTVDAGTVGSAMLVGTALGVFRDREDAAAHMVQVSRTYEPRQSIHEQYMDVYERYRKLYQAVRPLV